MSMAEKKDVAMNTFPVVTDSEYIYAESAEGSQIKMFTEQLFQGRGFFHIERVINIGGEYELPYGSGLIIIRDSTVGFTTSMALLNGNNNGSVLVNSNPINFFTEVIGKICVMNKGLNTKYVVKNKSGANKTITISFLNM